MPNGDRFLEGEARRPGMPPWEQVTYAGDATTRRAAWDWLRKLEAYLQDQIDQGIMTTTEAASIWQHQNDRLFPQAGWKERQPTAVERYRQQMAGQLSPEQIAAGAGNPIREWQVPKPTQLVDLDMFATVKSFYSGLASDRRGQLDEAAGLYAEAQQTFIQQQGALPLGRGGDPAEQMWTAEEAIRNLRLRQASLAQTRNPYMQSTLELINQQVEQLRAAQGQLRELARTQARIAGQAEAPREGWRRPPMPEPRGEYPEGMMEKLPYTAQRYYGGRMGELWGEFEQAFPEARERWWRALHPEPEPSDEGPSATAISFAGQYGMSPEAAMATGVRYWQQPESPEWAGLTPQQRGELSWVARPEPYRRPTEPPKDPWEAWQEDYPYMQKFLTVPRAQRGFFPRRSVARGKWFV